jgi:hypothetical protein
MANNVEIREDIRPIFGNFFMFLLIFMSCEYNVRKRFLSPCAGENPKVVQTLAERERVFKSAILGIKKGSRSPLYGLYVPNNEPYAQASNAEKNFPGVSHKFFYGIHQLFHLLDKVSKFGFGFGIG